MLCLRASHSSAVVVGTSCRSGMLTGLIKSHMLLLERRDGASEWGGDLPAGQPLLFARLQRHWPIPLTPGGPLGLAHRPPCLVLGVLLSMKCRTARGAVAEGFSGSREGIFQVVQGCLHFWDPEGTRSWQHLM